MEDYLPLEFFNSTLFIINNKLLNSENKFNYLGSIMQNNEEIKRETVKYIYLYTYICCG